MIVQFVSETECLGCRGCCRFSSQETVWSPALSADEAALLAARQPTAVTSPLEKRLKPVWHAQSRSFVCPLLDVPTNRCSIYTIRPFECQLYPFLVNRSSGKVYLAVDQRCPCVAREQKSARFQEYVSYIVGLLTSAPFSLLLASQTQLIQAYDDVFNLARLDISS